MGPGTLYRHFPAKEALFEAVVHERLRHLVDQARLLSGADDPTAALFRILRRVVADTAEKTDLIEALASAGIEVRTTVAASAAELRSEIGHILARAQDSGEIRDDIGIAELMAVLSGVLLVPWRSCSTACGRHRMRIRRSCHPPSTPSCPIYTHRRCWWSIFRHITDTIPGRGHYYGDFGASGRTKVSAVKNVSVIMVMSCDDRWHLTSHESTQTPCASLGNRHATANRGCG
jgi:hypothetical protein